MSETIYRLAALESRLRAIEDFLEIRERDNPMEANTLGNRILDGMREAADALSGNIELAEKSLSKRLSDLEAAQKKPLSAPLTFGQRKTRSPF